MSLHCVLRKLTSRISQKTCRRPMRWMSAAANSQESENSSLYDVVISGGGMVGLAMACALGHEEVLEDKKILLLESAPKKDFELGEKFSNRVSALSPATVKLLSSFNAWENILSMRAQPVYRMQVWEACSDSMITFNQNDLSQSLAHIVENDVTIAAITNQLEKIQNRVEIRYKTTAKEFELPRPSHEGSFSCSWANILLDDGTKIKTRLLIGADGFQSKVRQKAGIQTIAWDYKQRGVVATLHLSESSENNVAWQRFLPNGPVALLPLSDTRTSLIWTTTPEEAKMLLEMPEDTFIDALNSALFDDSKKDTWAVQAGNIFQDVLKNIIPGGTSVGQIPPTFVGVNEGSRAAFPLGLCHCNHYVKHRVALIGDAAHRVHPLAGQGVNLGFGDVTALTEVLVKIITNGGDIGSLGSLLEYETSRQRQVVPTMAVVDGLNRLYNTSLSPVVVLRSLGLQATNALLPLKEQIIKLATG